MYKEHRFYGVKVIFKMSKNQKTRFPSFHSMYDANFGFFYVRRCSRDDFDYYLCLLGENSKASSFRYISPALDKSETHKSINPSVNAVVSLLPLSYL